MCTVRMGSAGGEAGAHADAGAHPFAARQDALGGLARQDAAGPVMVVDKSLVAGEEPMPDKERKSATINEVYRLRCSSRLIGKFEELQNQQIHFASPEKLNDPMEGIVEFNWSGDRIVWTNLFRNYIYSLHRTIALIRLVGNSEVIKPECIPVEGCTDETINLNEMQILDEVCNDIYEKTDLFQLIDNLASAPQGAQHDEVTFYLQSIHTAALYSINRVHVKFELNEDVNSFPELEKPPMQLSELPGLIDQLQREEIPVPRQVIGGLFSLCGRIADGLNLVRKYQFRTEGKESENILLANRELVILDFPRLYVDQLSRLLHDRWYVACFMKDYRNSSVWGHYGNNHRGACLVFSSEKISGTHSLPVNKITGFSNSQNATTKRSETRYHCEVVQMKFHDVRYQEKIEQINFFQNIGVLPAFLLMRNWYSDASGNRSECGNHIGSSEEDSWREEYWSKFYRDITAKTLDWKYEKECRLILHSSLMGS